MLTRRCLGRDAHEVLTMRCLSRDAPRGVLVRCSQGGACVEMVTRRCL